MATDAASAVQPHLSSYFKAAGYDDAVSVLTQDALTKDLIEATVKNIASTLSDEAAESPKGNDTQKAVTIGLAALDTFLQINVTGPVVSHQQSSTLQEQFETAWKSATNSDAKQGSALRRACLNYLQVAGVSPYAYISQLELFCLARFIFVTYLGSATTDEVRLGSADSKDDISYSLSWMKLRIHVWHYKLITQPSLGGSNFTKSSQWSDLPTLASSIFDTLAATQSRLVSDDVWSDDSSWNTKDQVLFLVEAANIYILLGQGEKAKDVLQKASKLHGFDYVLSGALGKRTKFQEKSTSQLVVLARSHEGQGNAADDEQEDEEASRPQAVELNDDTLLEDIEFTSNQTGSEKKDTLPTALADISPENQPQLDPLDQIILLTEATIKDAFSPVDDLTSEEILPFASRVLADKSTNWQTYTQALLVRSRIEVHRSRTVERGVLQMQAVADQVLSDTTQTTKTTQKTAEDASVEDNKVPSIQVSAPDQPLSAVAQPSVPTTFLPAPTASESAPAEVRLRYIHALSTPPKWHLESELAYSWAGVGSLVSALDIFKRLRLWAEVALCLASAAALEDPDGRGSGGEDKATGIIRWRLFHKTGHAASSSSDPDDEVSFDDVTNLKAADFQGPERQPSAPDATRLWCILGDLQNDPAHYERAWEISNHRYARAQRSLGEYYLSQKDWEKAQIAFKTAASVNRLNPELWSRLGDISLRLGKFEDAAEAFSRSIGSATGEAGGEDAKTWSNLGSALWSLYCEVTASEKDAAPVEPKQPEPAADEDENSPPGIESTISRDPIKLLAQSHNAYKKGASIAHDNWRIWENVITLSARMRPPAVTDLILGMRHVLRIRKTEDAVNDAVVGALLQQEVLTKEKTTSSDIYEPPRGTVERLVTILIEDEIVPLITNRPELWALVSKLRSWRRDYAGAIDASERAWRVAFGSASSGLLAGESTTKDWTVDEAAWLDVVKRTDDLVSVLENWGPDVEEIGTRWKAKARSAVRSVMGRGKENWEDTEGWKTLENLMDELKVSRD